MNPPLSGHNAPSLGARRSLGEPFRAFPVLKDDAEPWEAVRSGAAGQPEIAARHPARAAAWYLCAIDLSLKAYTVMPPSVCTTRCLHADRPAANARAYPGSSCSSREASARPASRISTPTLSVASHRDRVRCRDLPTQRQRTATSHGVQSGPARLASPWRSPGQGRRAAPGGASVKTLWRPVHVTAQYSCSTTRACAGCPGTTVSFVCGNTAKRLRLLEVMAASTVLAVTV
jgi:hypothetical protein